MMRHLDLSSYCPPRGRPVQVRMLREFLCLQTLLGRLLIIAPMLAIFACRRACGPYCTMGSRSFGRSTAWSHPPAPSAWRRFWR